MRNPLGAKRTKEDWHLSQDDLLLHLDGERPAQEAAKARDHLQACWTCRTKRQKIQETISAFVDYLNGSFARNLPPPPRRWRTFQTQLGRVVAESRMPPAPSSWLAALRGAFPGLPLGLRFAAALLAVAFVFLVLLVLNRVPPVSANQVIQKAAAAQKQRIQAVPEPVVYQRLRVDRKSKAAVEDSSITWEVWNDEHHGRFRQRAGDATGRRFIDAAIPRSRVPMHVAPGFSPAPVGEGLHGPPDQGSTARVLPYSTPALKGGTTAQPHKTDHAPAHLRAADSATAPPMLRELEGVLQANQMDPRRPISAAGYESWRRAVPRDSEEVIDTRLPYGDKAITLTTAAAGPFAPNAIIKATLVVRTEDWHPVEQRLEVQGADGVRDYDLTETAFEVVSLDNLNPLIFADLERPALPAPSSRRLTTPPLQFPTGADLVAAEINARYALHRLRACVGESIEVTRDSTGHVEVRGVVEAPERKQELLAALQGIALVRANIQTVAEAKMAAPAPPESSRRSESGTGSPPRLVGVPAVGVGGGPARPESSRQSEKREEGPLAHQANIVQVQSSKFPIEDQLREYFTRIAAGKNPAQAGKGSAQAGIERQIADFSSQAVSLSLSASAEAGALRELAENYPPARIKELDPASRWLLEVMLRDHLAALDAHLEQSAALLRPVLSSFWKQDVEYPPRGDTPPSDLPDTTGLTWEALTFRVLAKVEHAERLTDYLFAGASLPAGQNEAVRDLLADLNQMDHEIHRLSSCIGQDFSAGTKAANVTNRPQ